MLYDFDFQKEKDFFTKSLSFQKFYNDINVLCHQHGSIDKDKQKFIDGAIHLWAESILKHNLDCDMLSIDVTQLMSDSNSKLVLDTFGKIYSKRKDKRTNTDFAHLNIMSKVDNHVVLDILIKKDEGFDFTQQLKNEYLIYKNIKSLPIKVKPYL